MKRFLCNYLIVLGIVASIPVASGNCKALNAEEKKGQAIHLEILSRHRNAPYELNITPFLYAELTDNPLSCVLVPEDDWKKLGYEQKKLLTKYAASPIEMIKTYPHNYTISTPGSIIFPTVLKNIAKMTQDSWCIALGRASEDSKEMYLERIIELKDF